MREQVSASSPLSSEQRRASKEPAFQFARSGGRKFVFSSECAEKLRDGGAADQRVERREKTSREAEEEEEEGKKVKEEAEEEMESGEEEEEERSAVAEGGERESNGEEGGGGAMVLLQWGHRKRPRCSRAENSHHHATITDESSSRKPSSRGSKAGMSSAAMASVKVKPASNGVSKETAEMEAMEERRRRRVKTLRGAAMACNHVEVKNREELRKKTEQKQQQQQKKSGAVFEELQKQKPRLLSSTSAIAIAIAKTSPPSHQHHHHEAQHQDQQNQNQNPVAATPLKVQKKMEWPKLLICLSRKEKEDDFLIFKGSKLPQRPKRRSKTVEKLLHYCTPGNWLTDLSHGRYDVVEKKSVKKKPRGLKAMESMDNSDSE